jgi:Secretion system C-terminal sorting domain
LAWKTTNEVNFSHFLLEKSLDGVNFSSLTRIESNPKGFYQFVDNNIQSRAYYRLKIVDNDGRFEYSKTIVITRKAKDAVSIYPNPTEGILNISTDDYEQAFVVVNSIGQVVLQGEQLDKTINLQPLPNGFYYLKIGTQTMKVVKE